MMRSLRKLGFAFALLGAAACSPGAIQGGGQITSVSPDHMPNGVPVQVVVAGSGFSPTLQQGLEDSAPQVKDPVVVLMDNAPLATTFVSDTQVSITIPANATPGPHALTAARGSTQLTGSVTFTVDPAITLQATAPTDLVEGEQVTLDVTVANAASADAAVLFSSTGDGTFVDSTFAKQQTVPAGASAVFHVPLTALETGSGSVALAAVPTFGTVQIEATRVTLNIDVGGAGSSSGSSGSTSASGSSGSSSASSSASGSSSSSSSSSSGSSSSSSSSSSSGSTASGSGSGSGSTVAGSGSGSGSGSTVAGSGSGSGSTSAGSGSGSTSAGSGSGSTSAGSGSGSSSGSTGSGGACTVSTDCPNGQACDTNTGLCSNACGGSGVTDCNGGCCDGSLCQPGTAQNACGSGGACSACSAAGGGAVCIAGANGGSCGCNSATDCNQVQACDTGTHLCGSGCGSANQTACNGGTCVSGTCAILGQGVACGGNAECDSSECVDGVCCDVACTGLCMACSTAKGAAVDGTCGPVGAGTDPDSECSQAAASSCGQDGFCDGAGACELYGSTTVCAAGSCTGGTETADSLCNGSGSCIAGGTSSCANHLQCGGSTCLSSCSGNGDCDIGYYCANPGSSGACTPKVIVGGNCTADDQCLRGACVGGTCQQLANGAACAGQSQCTSDACVDGVCCNTSCNGTCMACSAAKTGGADGTCAPITQGTDPDSECADDGAESCRHDGFCDGAGACEFYPSGTTTKSCSPDDTGSDSSVCNGSGGFGIGTSNNCKPYLCDEGTGDCFTSCTDVGQCRSGFQCTGGACLCTDDASCGSSKYCDGSGICQDRHANGGTCSADDQCTSSYCDLGTGLCAAAPTACTDDTPCSGSTPVCDTVRGFCVECTQSSDCTTPPSTCADSTHVYASPGTCTADACSYAADTTACANGCSSGVCIGFVGDAQAIPAPSSLNRMSGTPLSGGFESAGQPVIINVIIQPDGVTNSASLTYTTNDFGSQTAIPMSIVASGSGAEVWSASIPAQAVGTQVGFFIEAVTSSGSIFLPGGGVNYTYLAGGSGAGCTAGTDCVSTVCTSNVCQ